MKVEDCFYLGYISKTIGTKGELAFKLDVDSPSSYTSLSSVLVQIHAQDSQLVPYFLKESRLINDGTLRCSIEGIKDQGEAKNMVGKSLFLPLNLLPPLKEDQFYFHEIIGFEVIDQNKGAIGKVVKVLEYSTSNLLAVEFETKEILIPISDETIVKVDKKGKKLHVNCPEGLIDLYLAS
jgi:16S rRNA processing protein RimM